MSNIVEVLSFLENGTDLRQFMTIVIMSVFSGIIINFINLAIKSETERKKAMSADLVIIPLLTGAAVYCTGTVMAAVIIAAELAVSFFVKFSNGANDSNENINLLWAAVTGICIGENEYIAAGILCTVIVIIMIISGRIKKDNVRTLTIRGEGQGTVEAGGLVFRTFNNRAVLKEKASGREGFTLVYEVPDKAVSEAERKTGISITDYIKKLDGIRSVDLSK